MSSENDEVMHRIFRVRPAHEGSWLILKEHELFDCLRTDYGDVKRWDLEYVGLMTEDELDRLPEFDGW